MNKRISELKQLATTPEHGLAPYAGGVTKRHFDADKFATLIIDECISIVSPVDEEVFSLERHARNECVRRIIEHFNI